MKPLVILNIVLALVLSGIIAVILVERHQERNRIIAQSIESLEQIIIEQATSNRLQLQIAWEEGFIASENHRIEVVKSFRGSGRLDQHYIDMEFKSRFWGGTNANPYRPR
jgi:hypothetical protein